MEQETMLPEIQVPSTPEPEVKNKVSLTPTQTGDSTSPVSLRAPSEATVWPSPELATIKADKTQFGSGPYLNQPKEQVFQGIVSGQENNMRKNLASIMDVQDAQARQKKLVELASQQGALDPNKLAPLLQNTSNDPDTIVEQNFAKKWIKSLGVADSNLQGTLYTNAVAEMPEAVKKIEEDASDLLTKREYAISQAQNIREVVKQQGWVPYLADQAKSLFQPYVEAKLRGNVDGVGAVGGGVLLGDNLKEQATALYYQPLPEFKKNLANIVNNLQKDNPSLAEQFINYVVGMSTSDRVLNNTFTMISVPDYLAIGKAGAALTRKAYTYNSITRAAKDQLLAAKPTDNLAATAAEGAGDVGEAAVQNNAQKLQLGMEGKANSSAEAAETLVSSMKADVNWDDAGRGSLSRELDTRLKDGIVERSGEIADVLETAQKVNRTPVSVALPEALRAIKESIKNQFAGIKDAILDISNPQWNSTTNTWWHDVTFGNFNGELFSNPNTARNWAKLHGMVDADIIDNGAQGAFKFYIPESSAKTVSGKANPNFGVKVVDGSPTFYSDIANDVAVTHSVTPKAGYIPVEVSDDGLKIKFHKTLDENTATIEQQGLGYYVRVTKPMNETDESVRKFLLESKKAVSSVGPEGESNWFDAAVGKFRTADDVLSFNESVQRKAATYSVAGLQKVAKDVGKYIEQIYTGVLRSDPVTGEPLPWLMAKPRAIIGKLKRGEAIRQFDETLDFARSAKDGQGRTGYFFQTPAELQDHYLRYYKRLPSYAEHEAYFAFTQLVEYDRALRNLAEYRNRARVGAEQHSIRTIGPEGKEINSSFFDGVVRKEFPGGQDANILVMGAKQGDEKLMTLGNINTNLLHELQQGVKDGTYKVIDIYAWKQRPLEGFSNFGSENFRYVISRNVDTKALSLQQVERRGGGHFEYDYEHYIKQARIQANSFLNENDKRVVQHTYLGDTTLMPIEIRAMGNKIIPHLTEVQTLIKAKKLAEAQAYVEKNLPMEWKDVKSWFFPTTENGVTKPAIFSLTEPFHVVSRNKSIYDIDKSLELRYADPMDPKKTTFVDGSKSGSLADQYQVAYNTARDSDDVWTITATGTKDKPVYNYEPAKMVDPIPTMNRALQRAINSTFMDDYKIYGVEHWLNEAAPYLKEDMSSIRAAPFWNFAHTDEKSFKADAPKDKVWNLLANKQKIQQLIGTPDKFDTWVHGMTQTMADRFYEGYGPEAGRSLGGKAMTIVPLWMMDRVKDPVQFLRSMAFNFKLGLFSIPQVLVQAQTFASIISIAPKEGLAGTYATFLHQWARLTNEGSITKALDNAATKLNMFGSKWKSGEFTEARRELAKTGFEHVGGEQAMQDDIFKQRFIGNTKDNFLSAGQVPFREGEKATRIGAWYTAFREFRDANPTGAITNAQRAEILQRADLLTTNMSRASQSALHGGPLSLTTQFLTYQLRLAELFLGKRLGETTMERTMARARMVGMYSFLYGVPTAFGLSGYPLGDDIRQSAIDNGKLLGVKVQPGGYVVGDNQIRSIIMEGVPAWAGAMISGWGDTRRGTWYNFGDRYGAQGFTQIRDALRSDTTWWKLLGGASITTLVNTLKSTDNLMYGMVSWARGDSPEQQYRLTSDDWLDLTKEISSVNSLRKLIIAMNYNKWLSTNGAYVQDISKMDSVFRTVTGLTDQRQNDMFDKAQIQKGEQDYQKDALKEFTTKWRQAILAQESNPQEAERLRANAMVRLFASGYPVEKRLTAIAIANKGYEEQLRSAAQGFATKDVPMEKREQRIDQFRRELKLNQEKGQQ